ncbi:hypothetical protein [Paraburkholderia sp.]|uniref:hypothetical protein n=1 Tax=Paraburkholderia sp. TaxID=1926495 RepID=UPI003C7DA9EA
MHAVYAGHNEKATIGLARWAGSAAEFGDAATVRLTGFQRVGKAGDGTFNGSAVWATEMNGAIQGTPYFAILYVLRDKDEMLCWVFALSAYPVDTGFLNRTWTLAQAAGVGEYPK